MRQCKRHKHQFSALWWHFGPYGRQDVHVHSCFDHAEDDVCHRVLIGPGRDCDGDSATHWRETLDGGDYFGEEGTG